MASPAPAKSQPLHNFSLPHLKWSKNHSSNHHRGRRPSDSPPPPDSVLRNSPSSETPARRPSPLLASARRLDSAKRQSPMRDSASETESGYGSERRKKLAAESGRISLFVSPPRDQAIERPPAIPEADVPAPPRENRSSKIYIRLPKKAPEVPEKAKSADVPEEPKKVSDEPKKVPEEPKKVSDEGKRGPEAMEFDEFEGKTWNLRPRKPLHKKPNGGTSKSGGGGGAPPQQAAANRPEANSSRGGAQATAEKKDNKPKFAISLTKQEIEDDIFIITGSKPNRRPKKRAKNVQKQIDNLNPGQWLVNVTPDLYKVPENTPKVKTLK